MMRITPAVLRATFAYHAFDSWAAPLRGSKGRDFVGKELPGAQDPRILEPFLAFEHLGEVFNAFGAEQRRSSDLCG